MPNGEYGLGVDIGGATIATVVAVLDDDDPAGGPPCVTLDDQAEPLAAAFTITATGRPSLGEAAGGAAAERRGTARLLERVGTATPLVLGAERVVAARAVAALTAEVVAAVAGQRGRPPAWTTLAVPPSWGEHRCAALVAALAAEGLPRVSVVSGAVASVRAVGAAGGLAEGSAVLVLDLGASTLDAAVVRIDADGTPVHATVPPAPLRWGGWDVDDTVLAHVRSCLDGPWDDSDPAGSAALRAACTAAKEELSTGTTTQVPLGPAGSGLSVRLTREELEELLDDGVDDVVRAAADAAAAGGSAGLAAVVLVGGGAQMPLLAERLSAELDVPLVVQDDPDRTLARGAALEAADHLVGQAAWSPAPPALPAGGVAPRTASGNRGPRNGRPAPRPATGRPDDRPTARGRTTLRRGVLVAGFLVALVLAAPVLLAVLGAAATEAPAGTPATVTGTISEPTAPPAHELGTGSVVVAAATAAREHAASGSGSGSTGSGSTSSGSTSRGSTGSGSGVGTGGGGHGTSTGSSAPGAVTPGTASAGSSAPAAGATDPGTVAPPATDAVTSGTDGATSTDPTTDPVADPPVADPPVADPPVTDPPVTDPPVTDPPVTDPPVADPPVADPPAADPPAAGETPAQEPTA